MFSAATRFLHTQGFPLLISVTTVQKNDLKCYQTNCRRGKKTLTEGQIPMQELKVGMHSKPFLPFFKGLNKFVLKKSKTVVSVLSKILKFT